MTIEPSKLGRVLIFDTMVLNHFALGERLDVLASLVTEDACATTTVVLEELRTGAGALVDSLRRTGHRLPCTGTEFPSFMRRFGLL